LIRHLPSTFVTANPDGGGGSPLPVPICDPAPGPAIARIRSDRPELELALLAHLDRPHPWRSTTIGVGLKRRKAVADYVRERADNSLEPDFHVRNRNRVAIDNGSLLPAWQ
jgi:hypothetical protein